MAFLDQKEEVFDIKLTPTGTRLLQHGAFKPAYYCFYDDDVLYDGKYGGDSFEEQNSIEKRIQDTPRHDVRRVGYSATEEINKNTKGEFYISEHDIFQSIGLGGALGLGSDPTLFSLYLGALDPSQLFAGPESYAKATMEVLGSYDGLFGVPSLKQPDNSKFFQVGPLGTMAFKAKNVFPKWNIDFLMAPLSGSYETNNDFGVENYVLQCDLQYKIHLNQTVMPEAVEADFEEEDILGSTSFERVGTSLEDLNASPISLDGTYLQVVDDYLFLKVEEEGTRFLQENFDIEMFVIEKDASAANGYVERKLYFDNENINLGDIFTSTTTSTGNPTATTEQGGFTFHADPIQQYNNSFIKYYFDILVDNEIPEEIYCKALNEDKLEQNYADQALFTCNDFKQKTNMDPYSLPDESTDVCED